MHLFIDSPLLSLLSVLFPPPTLSEQWPLSQLSSFSANSQAANQADDLVVLVRAEEKLLEGLARTVLALTRAKKKNVWIGMWPKVNRMCSRVLERENVAGDVTTCES